MESSKIKEEKNASSSEEETFDAFLGWNYDYSPVMSTSVSNFDLPDVEKENEEMITPFAFVSVGCDISPAEHHNEENLEEKECLVKMEDTAIEEDPLKIKPEEEVQAKYASHEASTSRGDDTNRILCASCNKSGEVSEGTFREHLQSFCDSCYNTFRKSFQEEWVNRKCQFYKPCLICLNAFNNELDFSPHICTSVNLFSCTKCNLIVDKKAYLVNHIKYCSSHSMEINARGTRKNLSSSAISSNLGCLGCNQSVMNKSVKTKLCLDNKKRSKTHLFGKNGKKSNYCTICKKSFCNADYLKVHSRIHTGEKPYTCNICEKSFRCDFYLKIHSQMHTGEKPYTCGICIKSFCQLGVLKSHMGIHTGKKPFTCKFCKKSFRQSNNFKSHLRIHTGEKPYTCEICKKSFREGGHLIRHFRIHTGEKPYSCDMCKKSFNKIDNLKRHLRIHTGEKPFSCEVCKKSFSRHEDLKTHLRIHSGENPPTCQVCKQSFSSFTYLKCHMRFHTGEKPFTCEVCKKSLRSLYSLKAHMRVHTGEKPFTCEVCKKSYSHLYNLKTHIKRIHTGK